MQRVSILFLLKNYLYCEIDNFCKQFRTAH